MQRRGGNHRCPSRCGPGGGCGVHAAVAAVAIAAVVAVAIAAVVAVAIPTARAYVVVVANTEAVAGTGDAGL